MRKASQSGIALLLVLWVLTILMVIVLSFSFMARTETHATLFFKEGMEKKFLAEAGVERAITELFYRSVNKGQTIILEGREVWKIDGTTYEGEIGGGRYLVGIADESGKLNINKMTDANAIILRQLLINLGVKDEEVNTIVDSILDWKDADDLTHLNGVESSYYMSLSNPYKAKDGDFDTVEELLLVKGMTPEILYGNGEKQGIIGFITANPIGPFQININAAPGELLKAVPGMTPEIVDSILSLRQGKEILTTAEVAGIPQQALEQFGVTATGSNTFGIEALGYKDNEKTGHAVKATVFIEGANKFRYLSYKSPAKLTITRTVQGQEG